MTLQEQLDQLVLERADKDYYDNPVVLYQKIFETVKDQVNQQRRKNNTIELTEKLELAYFALRAKANAWASRSKDDFLAHIDSNVERQRNLSYRDNPYTEIYLKYLLKEKERVGY